MSRSASAAEYCRPPLTTGEWHDAVEGADLASADCTIDVTCERLFRAVPPPNGAAEVGNEVVAFWDLADATVVAFVGKELLRQGRFVGTIGTTVVEPSRLGLPNRRV